MQFFTLAQKKCYTRILPWMRQLFGAYVMIRLDLAVFDVSMGSTSVQVEVSAWGEDDATITSRAYLVSDLQLTPGLMRFLLRENDKMRFGAFGIDGGDNIFFEHTVVGSTCDIEELRGSVLAVISTAGQYAQEIIDRWGGSLPARNPPHGLQKNTIVLPADKRSDQTVA